jgi:hypothetical protein
LALPNGYAPKMRALRCKSKDGSVPLGDRETSRIPYLAKIEGEFLEGILPVQGFATLTTPRRVTKSELDSLYARWIVGLQARHRATLGWVRSIETNPSPHIHVALVAAVPMDCAHAAMLWSQIAGARYLEAARVEPDKLGLCGLGYVLKQLGSAASEPQFSDNIRAFALSSGKSYFRTSSAQRRQVRRIKAQLADPIRA